MQLKGNWIFFGLACFVGSLCSLEKWHLTFLFFLLYLLFLWRVRRFTSTQLLLVVCFFLLFFVKAEVDTRMSQTRLTGEEKELELTFLHPFKLDGNYFSAYGEEVRTNERLVIQYRLATLKQQQEVSKLPVGAVCKVRGKLEEPGVARNTNAFNYKEYLRHEKIYYTFKVDTLDLHECTQEKSLYLEILNLRQKGIGYIYSHFPQDTAPLAAALIYGDRNIMEPDLMTAYQRLGIVHLLAISGLNVGMLIGILFYLGIRLHITREKMTNILLAFLPVYMILTGGTPSVVRACLMMMLALLLAKFYKSKLIPTDILSIVFMLYIFYEPNVIYDVGFQLSFVVTCSLVLSTSILSKYMQTPVSFLIATSLVSQLASMPILLYHFYEFSIVSVFVNVLYVPLFSAILSPALLGLYILHLILGDLLNPLLFCIDFFLHFMNRLTLFLSSFPFSTVVLGRPSSIVLFLYCLVVPYSFYQWEKAGTWKQSALAMMLPFSIIFFHFATEKMNLDGEITIVDVGQGDSIFIRLPLNKGTYLIDTGGTMVFPSEEWEVRKDPFEVGKDVLIPFLKGKGITELDKLILTHGDMDHVGGAMEVLKTIQVKEVVLPRGIEQSSLEKEIMRICKEKKISIHYGAKGDQWKMAASTFTILSPSEEDQMERNDQSIVLYTQLGGKSWLFTGDIESEGEMKLLERYPGLTVDILKVGHHGSKTSTSDQFLEQLRPKVALISAGVDNRFGHPHGEVIQRLESNNVIILRTDRHGAISYRFRGNNGTFFTELHTIEQIAGDN